MTALLDELSAWAAAGLLRPLDVSLTRFIQRMTPENDPAVLLAMALTSERNGHGHVCLDLAQALAHPERLLNTAQEDRATAHVLQEKLSRLRLDEWVERLQASAAVASAREAAHTQTPLVLEAEDGAPRLYLRRYWAYEQTLVQQIAQRLAEPPVVRSEHLRLSLAKVFPKTPSQLDWQHLACALAARSRLFILTGGPGTGKTTTVVRLLALLHHVAAQAGEPAPHIELAAPTGKAAARLSESMRDQWLATTPQPLPTQVKTLHRLLGPRHDSRAFAHHAGNPLAADVVVVDEASMVDVEMMVHLLNALRPQTRLILLGDKDQLASVEAGAILGDLCHRAAAGHYTPATRDWLQAMTGQTLPDALIDPAGRPLDQAIAMLRISHRFSASGGIGALATRINAPVTPYPHAQAAWQAIAAITEDTTTDPRLGQVEALAIDTPDDPQIAAWITQHYREAFPTLQHPPAVDAPREVWDQWALDLLNAQKRFQLLTPLRRGPWGSEGLNAHLLQVLRQAGLLPQPPHSSQPWYSGRPVLITANDYSLNLMNGDVGLTLPSPISNATTTRRPLRVAFPDAEHGVRWVLPNRLRAVETVFAMTVHKSQGSEFEHTALIVPKHGNPILTRELLYTAITRSRSRFTLFYGSQTVLGEAILKQVQRDSGMIRLLG